jgi:hypothetical protein
MRNPYVLLNNSPNVPDSSLDKFDIKADEMLSTILGLRRFVETLSSSSNPRPINVFERTAMAALDSRARAIFSALVSKPPIPVPEKLVGVASQAVSFYRVEDMHEPVI